MICSLYSTFMQDQYWSCMNARTHIYICGGTLCVGCVRRYRRVRLLNNIIYYLKATLGSYGPSVGFYIFIKIYKSCKPSFLAVPPPPTHIVWGGGKGDIRGGSGTYPSSNPLPFPPHFLDHPHRDTMLIFFL